MDTSKQYIKMCQMAVEVQALHDKYDQKLSIIPNLYSRYVEKHGDVYTGESIIPPAGQKDDEFKQEIWLPRQDQLQDMLDMVTEKDKKGESEHRVLNLLNDFRTFTNEIDTASSFEKLWLMYVMSMNSQCVL